MKQIIKGRGTKAAQSYITLLVYLATKAIHLKLVTDCTCESFINARNDLSLEVVNQSLVCQIIQPSLKELSGNSK